MRQAVRGFKNKKIIVFGDVMVDEYVECTPTRLSPEAPVPVLKPHETVYRLGGAGNVAANVVSLGGQANLITCYGNDDTSRRLMNLVSGHGLTITPAASANYTTRKTRIIGRQGQRMHQYVRLDHDAVCTCDASFLARFLETKDEVHAVIVSDYGKGTVTPEACIVIKDFCSKRGIPWIVDPKPGSAAVEAYARCTLIKPNWTEAEHFFGRTITQDTPILEVCHHLTARFQAYSTVVTAGHEGIYYYERTSQFAKYAKAGEVEVMDVTGAGDTIAAVLGLCLGSNVPLDQACQLACEAGRICVAMPYTAPVLREQLLDALPQTVWEQKVFETVDDFIEVYDQREPEEVIVMANGCFDLLHAGHVDLLKQASALGNKLIVALNSDRSVRELKGQDRPINTWSHRAEVLAALACVDAVVGFDEASPAALIERLRPDVVVHGDESKDTPAGIEEREKVQKYGGQAVYIHRNLPLSSTSIHAAAKENPDHR